MKHINYRSNEAKSVASNVAHMVISALLRYNANHAVFKDEFAMQHMTIGQIKVIKEKGKYLFHQDANGVFTSVDIEGGKLVRRIPHKEELDYIIRELVFDVRN